MSCSYPGGPFGVGWTQSVLIRRASSQELAACIAGSLARSDESGGGTVERTRGFAASAAAEVHGLLASIDDPFILICGLEHGVSTGLDYGELHARGGLTLSPDDGLSDRSLGCAKLG